MEHLLFQMIGIGFVMLTLHCCPALFSSRTFFGQHLVHKTILSIIAWLVFATLLWGRPALWLARRIAIRYTLGGFILLMLAYFGTKLVLELVLNRPY